jgi:PAS domain S-box-containing protein
MGMSSSDIDYRKLINAMKHPVFVIQDGKIVLVNSTLCQISEYSEDDLLGSDFSSFIAEEKREDAIDYYKKRVAGEDCTPVYESLAVTKTGKPAFQVFVQDISRYKEALKKVQESEERFRFLSQSTFEGIFIHKNGIVLDCNDSFLRMYGYLKEEIIGKDMIETVICERDREKIAQNIVKKVAKPYIIRALKKDGSSFIAEIEARNVEYNGEGVRIAAVRDVSERFKMQKEIEETESTLQRREEQYRTVFKTTGTAMCIVENDGTISLANEQFEKLAGYPMKDIVGKMRWMDFVVEEDLDRMLAQHKLRRKAPESALHSYEFRFVDKKQNIKHIQLTVDVIPGTDKSVTSLSDITARVEAELLLKQNEERMRSITESAKDAIIQIDHNGRVIFWNPAAESIFGYSENEMLGENLHELIAPEEYHQIQKEKFAHFIKTGQGPAVGKTTELKGKRKNGEIFPVELSLSPTEINSQWGATGILRDITQRKKYEEQVLKLLEDQKTSHYELEEKNKQLEQEKKKAVESDHLKSAFLATMSHELRTPLNHIIGFSDILPDMTDDPQIIKFSNLIHKGGIDLLNMIEDIFDLAMIEKTEVKVRASEVKIRDIYADVKKELQESLYESDKREHISLEFSIDPSITDVTIVTDKPKIIQVITNLIKNAVKYTFRGTIGLEMWMDSAKKLSIGIRDTGIGVPAELHEKIFEFFRQGDDSHTRVHGGIGLGLAISQKIAHAMNGEILLESEVGKGSLFTFVFPVNILGEKSESSAAAISSGVGFSLEGKKILLAEDDPTSMDLIKIVLEPHGGEIICAENGKLALEYVEKGMKPDIILMDLKMPVMDGFTATKEIRKIFPEVPVIALTAYALVKDEEKAKDAGCDVVVTKPIKIDRFIDTLKKYIAD